MDSNYNSASEDLIKIYILVINIINFNLFTIIENFHFLLSQLLHFPNFGLILHIVAIYSSIIKLIQIQKDS